MFNTDSPHIPEALLRDYVAGSLEESDRASAEEHLLICESCRQRLDDREFEFAAAEAARRLQRRGEPTNERIWMQVKRGWPVALAAGLALVVFLSRPQVTTSYTDVPLRAVRGAAIGTARAPAGKPIRLQIDLTELPPQPELRVEVVTAQGEPVWQSTHKAAQSLVIPVDRKLAAGTYWVRLYAANSVLLREFGLQVQ